MTDENGKKQYTKSSVYCLRELNMKTKAQELLKKVYGHHQFRPGQQELVEGLLENRDVLGVISGIQTT